MPAPNPPIPYPPNDPIPCAVIADPPPEVTAILNPQQLANVKAWAFAEAQKNFYSGRNFQRWLGLSAAYQSPGAACAADLDAAQSRTPKIPHLRRTPGFCDPIYEEIDEKRPAKKKANK